MIINDDNFVRLPEYKENKETSVPATLSLV